VLFSVARTLILMSAHCLTEFLGDHVLQVVNFGWEVFCFGIETLDFVQLEGHVKH
jgi:hypothetical protein